MLHQLTQHIASPLDPPAFSHVALQLVAAGDKAGLGTGLKLVEKVKSTVNAVKVCEVTAAAPQAALASSSSSWDWL